MKLVLKIAGGLVLAVIIVTVAAVACTALFLKGASDALVSVSATTTAECGFGSDKARCCPTVFQRPADFKQQSLELCSTWYGGLAANDANRSIDVTALRAEMCRSDPNASLFVRGLGRGDRC